MNSTAIGNKYEEDVYNYFKHLISSGNFIAKANNCKIYAKKGYYSNDRKSNIIFDISIEIFLPDHKNYSILLLIECKKYTHKVPVNDVEEFYGKVEQISSANTKAIMVSNNAFQSGSFEFSKSKGIGLLRYCGVEELDWVLDRSPSSIIFENDSSNSYSAMNYEKFTNKYYDLYCFVDGLFTCSLHIFLKNFIDITLKIIPISLNVPYLNETIISSKCTEILQRVNYTNGVVPIEEIRDLLISEENLKFDETLSLPSGVLGKITFKPFKISILQNQIEARKRFTIAHEFGHYFLEHSKYMKSEKCRESSVNNDISIKIKDIIRLEWQANQFAACLLMPEKIFSKDFIEFGKERSFFNKGVAYLYVDSQPVNIESFNQITSFLKNKYKVSKFAVKYRLKQLGLITGPELKEKSLGDFLNP